MPKHVWLIGDNKTYHTSTECSYVKSARRRQLKALNDPANCEDPWWILREGFDFRGAKWCSECKELMHPEWRAVRFKAWRREQARIAREEANRAHLKEWHEKMARWQGDPSRYVTDDYASGVQSGFSLYGREVLPKTDPDYDTENQQ